MTNDLLMRALEIAVEQLLLRDGASSSGVDKKLADQVQMYLDMAAGKREIVFGSKFRPKETSKE